jgi:hypothetical protein
VQVEVVGSRAIGSFRARCSVAGTRWADALANVSEWRSVSVAFRSVRQVNSSFGG